MFAATATMLATADAETAGASQDRPLRIAIPTPPTNFDPVQTVDVETLQIHLNTHAYLVHPLWLGGFSSLVSDPQKEKGAVNAWTWKQAAEWGRDSSRFCGPEGRSPIQQEDVIASLERAAHHPRSRVAWALERMRRKDDGRLAVGVDRGGNLTIEFTEDLHISYANSLLALPQLAVLPSRTSENVLPHQSSYGGDYRIKKADGQRLLLERCNAPENAAKEIELEVVRDSHVALAGLLAGRFDVIRADYSAWLGLQQRGLLGPNAADLVQFVEGGNNLELVVFNVRNPKLANAAVRRALLHALDTRRLCNDVFQGFCQPSGFDPTYARYQSLYDPALAKSLWQEASARPETLELLTLADDFHQKMAAWLAAEWRRELGVKVVLRSLNFASLVGELMSGKDYDAAMLWIQPLSSLPEVRYLLWTGDPPPKGRNFARYDSLAWQKAIESARRMGLGKEDYAQIAKVLLDDPPVVPLVSIKGGWFIGRGVRYSAQSRLAIPDVLMFRHLRLYSIR